MNFSSVGIWMLALHLFQNFIDLYLRYKQLQVLDETLEPPDQLAGLMTEETFELSRSYGIHKEIYNIVKLIVLDIIIGSFEIYANMLGSFWNKSQNFIEILQLNSSNEIMDSLVFMLLMFAYNFIKEIPFTLYRTFVIEGKFGFNNQTLNFFLSDQWMLLKVKVLYLTPMICSIVIIVKITGVDFIVSLWLFCAAVQFFTLMVFPVLILPLFDNIHPLEDGELKDSINALGTEFNIKTEKVWILEGKTRSAHTNAFVTGFGKFSRIVIYDTLLTQEPEKVFQNDEIVAILVHEIGHWKYYHLYVGYLAAQLVFCISFFIFAKIYKNLCFFAAIGFPFGNRSVIVAMLIARALICNNINTAFLLNSLSRKIEYEADTFAKKAGYGAELKSALIRSSIVNLVFPVCNKHYSARFNRYPTLLERVDHLSDKPVS